MRRAKGVSMARKPKAAAKPEAKAKRPHLTDRAGAKIAQMSKAVTRSKGSTAEADTTKAVESDLKVASGLLVSDLLLRTLGRLARHSVEKGVLGHRYGNDAAKAAVENRSLMQTAMVFGATRLATRSLPGAALVWGGILAKTLYDRRRARRAAERSGELPAKRRTRRARKPD